MTAARKKAAARASSSRPDTVAVAVSEQELRTAALDASDDDDDKGATNAREYFARCNRPGNAPATIDDVCGVLEYFGVTALPDGHAAR